MKKIVGITLLVLLGIAAIGTLVYLYQKSIKEPVVYELKTPTKTNIVKKTVATGSIEPRKEIELKPQLSGIIQELYVEAGDVVQKGDIIAKVEVIPDMITLNNSESRVKKAEISYKEAQTNYQRNKILYEKNVIPEAEYLEIKLAFETAEEELESAEINLQLVKEGVSKKTGKATNTLIRSTISGTILNVPVEEGNSVIEANTFNAGTTVATVANMNDMIFKGKVDESEVGKILPGMELRLSIGALENVTFLANLEYISPKGVEENGAIQFEIKASIKLDKDHFIRAGYSATADIVLDSRDSVLAIDERLLQFEKDDATSAFVEIKTAPQTFEKRKVEVGLSDGINIEILSGLELTDSIKTPL